LELRGSRKILGSYRFFNEGKLKMLLWVFSTLKMETTISSETLTTIYRLSRPLTFVIDDRLYNVTISWFSQIEMSLLKRNCWLFGLCIQAFPPVVIKVMGYCLYKEMRQSNVPQIR
jgi:hypothetical protein